jgi:hypothetical protein
MLDEAVMDEIEAPAEEMDEAPIDATELGDEAEPEAEEPSEEPAEGEPDEEEQVEGVAPEKVEDGRKMPDNVKKGIAALKASNPEAARILKETYWTEQRFRSVFATPEVAAEAKNKFESLGGDEGLQQIQSERQEWEGINQAFTEGSGDFAKKIAENDPESFVKNAPHVVNEWATRAPEQYQYYAQTVALNTLASAGITLQNLQKAYNAEQSPEAKTILAEIHNALLPLEQQKVAFEQKRTDPREEALKQRESAFEQKRRADFEGGVATQAEKYLAENMKTALDGVVGARKVDPEAAKGFEKMINAEVMRMLGDTPNFATNLEAHYRTGDSAKSVAYITAQYNRILPAAAKVIEPYLRNITAVSKPAGKSGTAAPKAAAPGEVVLKEMPDWDKVDQSKTTVADMIMGKAVLSNGKRASGWA